MYSTPCSSMDLRRSPWMSRRRFSCAVRVTASDEEDAGERRDCHCEREATPVGSIIASSIAMVPRILSFLLVVVVF